MLLDSSWPTGLMLTIQEPVLWKISYNVSASYTWRHSGYCTAIGETEEVTQVFLMTKQDRRGENIPVLLLLFVQWNFQLSAVYQIPQGWNNNYHNTWGKALAWWRKSICHSWSSATCSSDSPDGQQKLEGIADILRSAYSLPEHWQPREELFKNYCCTSQIFSDF